MSKFNFSETELQKIKEKITEVEKKTSGEIVPYFVKKSDNYYEAPLIAVMIVALLSTICVNILSFSWLLPIKFDMLIYSLILIIILIITYIIVEFFDKIKIFFISEKREIKMVHKRAMEAFVTEEIFKTKERIGVLIFISELERNVTIIADSGINKKVKQEEWNTIIQTMTNEIKNKKYFEAVINAIENCGNLLITAGFANTNKKENELENELKKKNN